MNNYEVINNNTKIITTARLVCLLRLFFISLCLLPISLIRSSTPNFIVFCTMIIKDFYSILKNTVPKTKLTLKPSKMSYMNYIPPEFRLLNFLFPQRNFTSD